MTLNAKDFCILVVDDDEMARETVSETLSREGFRTLEADDGNTALPIVQAGSVDVVVTDVQMPGMGGVELLAAIGNHDSSIPVVLMSGYSSIGKSGSAGAVAFIRKPSEPGEISAVVRNACGLSTSPPGTGAGDPQSS